jgi:hypothetical protein
MICPNMRAAQIYIRQPSSAMFTRVVRAALADPRIDLVIWHSRSAGESSEAYVVESQRGRLEFWRAESSGRRGQDSYGTGWNWVGDLSVLSVDLDGGCLEWSDYPNAFERLAGVLDAPNSGEVWLTAEPGCEFEVAGQAAHVGGGSHGALHALDSHSLLLVGGADAPPLPRNLRTVDIAPLCMDLLGLTMRYRVGDPRPGGSGTLGG